MAAPALEIRSAPFVHGVTIPSLLVGGREHRDPGGGGANNAGHVCAERLRLLGGSDAESPQHVIDEPTWLRWAKEHMGLRGDVAGCFWNLFMIQMLHGGSRALLAAIERANATGDSSRPLLAPRSHFLLFVYLQRFDQSAHDWWGSSDCEWPVADTGAADAETCAEASRMTRRHNQAFLLEHLKTITTVLLAADPKAEVPMVLERDVVALDLLVAVDGGSSSISSVCGSADDVLATRFGRAADGTGFRATSLATGIATAILAAATITPASGNMPGGKGLSAHEQEQPHVTRPFCWVPGQGLTLRGATRGACRYVDGDDVSGVQDAVVEQCTLATVYLLAPFRNVLVSGCTSVVIVVGAVAGTLTVQRCRKCTIITTCAGVTLSSVDECQLFVCSQTQPVVTGRGRCTLAPLNVCYPTQAAHLAAAGCPATLLTPDGNAWARAVTVGAEARATPLPPDQFYEFRVPFYARDARLVDTHRASLPLEYREQLEGAEAAARRLREALASTNVDVATRREFAEEVEQRFLEWMRDTGADRQVEQLLDVQ